MPRGADATPFYDCDFAVGHAEPEAFGIAL